MTTYYIDPSLGSNSNNGLSWGAAWLSFYGIRANAISLLPGDRIHVAKSATKTGVTCNVSGNSTITFNGGTYVSLGMPGTWRHPLGGTTVSWVAAQAYTTFVTASSGPSMTDSTGKLSTVSTKLAYKATSSADMSAYTMLLIQMRMSVAYVGSGEQDLPPNFFEIHLCSDAIGNVPIVVIPVNTWTLNSTTKLSSYLYTHGSSLPTNVASVAIYRSSVSHTRDTVSWGVLFYNCTFFLGWSTSPSVSPQTVIRNPGSVVSYNSLLYAPFRATPYGYGWLDAQGCAISSTGSGNSNVASSFSRYYLSTTATATQTQALAYTIADIHMVGTSKWAAGSTQAAFDLNGTAGGTVGSPIVIAGGYNTSTGVVDGSTIFGGGRDTSDATNFLDLQSATYITMSDISVFYGFGSLVVNPGTGLDIQFATFNDSAPPVSGLTTAVDCKFTSCVSSRDGCTTLGTLGNLTLVNTVFATSDYVIPTTKTVECGTYTATNSVLFYELANSMTLSIRENAVVSNFILHGKYTWRFANTTNYGRTITFDTNVPETASTSIQPSLFRTLPNSRWEKVIYKNIECRYYDAGFERIVAPTNCNEEVVWENWTSAYGYKGPSGYAVEDQGSAIHYKNALGHTTLQCPVSIHTPYNTTLESGLLHPPAKIFIYTGVATGVAPYTPGQATYAAVYSYANACAQGVGAYYDNKRTVGALRHPTLTYAYNYTQYWPWGAKDGVGVGAGAYAVSILPTNIVQNTNPEVITISKAGVATIYDVANVHPIDIFQYSFGPVLNCSLQGGTMYALRMSVITRITLTYPSVPPAAGLPLAVATIPTKIVPFVPQYLHFLVMSMEVIAGSNKIFTYSLPVEPTGVSDWVDLEYPIYAQKDGEISLLICSMGNTNFKGAIIDALRVEEL